MTTRTEPVDIRAYFAFSFFFLSHHKSDTKASLGVYWDTKLVWSDIQHPWPSGGTKRSRTRVQRPEASGRREAGHL